MTYLNLYIIEGHSILTIDSLLQLNELLLCLNHLITIFVQYYPSVMIGTPALMLLLVGHIVEVLYSQLVLKVDYIIAEDFVSIENLDDFSSQGCILRNMDCLLVRESC